MKWAVIGTWKMAAKGTGIAAEILSAGGTCAEASLAAAADVEDNPEFHSVGYGGRPAADGRVVLDGGFMDGDTLHFGAVGAIEGFRSPSKIAYSLIGKDANNFLVGKGAEEYAEQNGFEKRNNLTDVMIELWQKERDQRKALSAYDGHDTVCFLALDTSGSMCACTSTSGLFMKERGRVGDTPVPGSGYYADSEIGAAAATGMGEEIMKGALSYSAVRYMKQGMSAQEAADAAVGELDRELKKRNGRADAMSLIVMDRYGNTGAGTNTDFTFAAADEGHPACIYTAVPSDSGAIIKQYTEKN